MRLWRLAVGRHHEMDGEGARLYGGRWNSRGVPVVYTSTHLSLAVLELLVHADPAFFPSSLRAFAITLPESATIERADPDERADPAAAGDRWVKSGRSLGLAVPSAVVPAELEPGLLIEERNVLLNPRHPAAASWVVVESGFRVDPRLRRRSPS